MRNAYTEFSAWLRSFAAPRFTPMFGATRGRTARNRRRRTLRHLVNGAFIASASLVIRGDDVHLVGIRPLKGMDAHEAAGAAHNVYPEVM